MASGYEVVDVVRYEDQEVSQEGVASEWKTVRAVFPNFAELPAGRDDFTESPVLKCHGLEWTIELYPGGNDNSSEEDVCVSMYLRSESSTDTNKIKAKYKIRVPFAEMDEAGEGDSFKIFSPEDVWGFHDCTTRADVLDASNKYLVDGNLTVEVDIQVMLDKPPTWTPTNTVCSDMLAFLDAADADNTDVTFEVASNDGKELFYAHGPILAARCPTKGLGPTLASLAEGCDPDTPIPIGDVQADVFRMLLRYVYGGEIPSKCVLREGRNIIRAADRFGCTGLKLAADAEMATAGITAENAAELILFADATNCAMLKETAVEFFVENKDDVMASEGFAQVKESPAVLTELIAAMPCGSKRPASSDAGAERDFKRMRVATLRQKLDEKKLGVDGSKDMLISRLEAAEAEARAQAEADAENGGDGDEVVEIE